MYTYSLVISAFFSLLLSWQSVSGQEKTILPPTETELNSLEALFGVNKTYPDRYKASILLALSHFPSLKSIPIEFKYAKITTSLNAKPTLGSLVFRTQENRKYIVRINNSVADSTITLDEASFNAQIGVFAHQLSHIKDYESKSFWKMLVFGLNYLKNSKKEIVEKEADRATIANGLGWQLYDWAHYLLEESDASYKYKQFKRDIYLKPFEIINTIESQDSSSILPPSETIELNYVQWGCLCPNWISVEDKVFCDSTDNKLIDHCIYLENATGHIPNLVDFNPERQNLIVTGVFVEGKQCPNELNDKEETVRPAKIFRYTKLKYIDTM